MLTKQPDKLSFLSMDAKILLHTRLAQSMFNYSWQHGKMGLLQFAKLTSTLWKAANQDDPYADWILLKTYQAIIEAQDKIKSLEIELHQQLAQIRGIETTPALNASPMSYPLQFSTIFGFMGATLLADTDYVIRQILTLKRLGILVQDDIGSINQVIKYLQDVFAVPRQWRHTGITRKDLLEKNQKAQDAIALLGDLPGSILRQKINFHSLPKYKSQNIYVDTPDGDTTPLHQ